METRVLTYHKINNPGQFERHLDIVKKYNCLITVDDGDISFYEHAFPLLCRYQVPCVLFIITGLIDSDKPFWWDEVLYYLGPEVGANMLRKIKLVPNKDREEFLTRLRTESHLPPLRQKQLTTQQLHEMQEAGIIIGNHSHTHPLFANCTEEEVALEIEESRKFFARTGLSGFEIFAYPNGSNDLKSETLLKNAGIQSAYLFDHKLNRRNKDNMRISRLSVNDYTSVPKLLFILSGLHSMILPLRKKLLHG